MYSTFFSENDSYLLCCLLLRQIEFVSLTKNVWLLRQIQLFLTLITLKLVPKIIYQGPNGGDSTVLKCRGRGIIGYYILNNVNRFSSIITFFYSMLAQISFKSIVCISGKCFIVKWTLLIRRKNNIFFYYKHDFTVC